MEILGDSMYWVYKSRPRRYFWEIRYYKGKWKIKLILSHVHCVLFEVLEDIPALGNHRNMQTGELVTSIIRLCHRKSKIKIMDR